MVAELMLAELGSDCQSKSPCDRKCRAPGLSADAIVFVRIKTAPLLPHRTHYRTASSGIGSNNELTFGESL